jgi:aminopeptidase N
MQDMIYTRALLFLACLIGILTPCSINAMESLPSYHLSVSFETEKNLVKGLAVIEIREEGETKISVDALRIISTKLNDRSFQPEIKDTFLYIKGKGTLEIVFEGMFRDESENTEQERSVAGNIISARGIALTGKWYPRIEGRFFYQLKALLPQGFIAISEADEVEAGKTQMGEEYSFSFFHPLQEISLIAGKYIQSKETFNGTAIYGYFLPEDISFGKTCLAYAKKYLGRYQYLLATYPYKRFSIVESFLPAVHSEPSFMLLNRAILHNPLLLESSISHEILHQWLGNFVYQDPQKGNWSEGLTSYLSDHFLAEQKNEGPLYRKNILTEYENYVIPEKEIPLKDFPADNDSAVRALGYGKSEMLFHMLKNLVGDEVFADALRGFIKEKAYQEASWDDIRGAFEKASGKNLEWFFTQWLNRKGIPSVEIREPRVVVLKGMPTVVFDVVQTDESYLLNLSVKIRTDKAEFTKKIKIEKSKNNFEIPVQGNPLEMSIDSNYDVMRKLSGEEHPAVISRLFGDNKKLIVVPDEKEKYAGFIDSLKKQGFAVKDQDDIRDGDIQANSLLVFGYDSPVLKRLFGGMKKTLPGFVLTVRKNPLNTAKVVAVADGDTQDAVDTFAEKIFNLGKYSFVHFQNGTPVDMHTDVTDNGIQVGLDEPVIVVEPRKAVHIDDIIKNILHKPVIYVGETHTNYEDHKVQLKVIMRLHEEGRKFAIGMEMFQKPFQKVMNDYLSGTISEREFLKNTQYFKRWQFDYNFYREIIGYAKAMNIPVIALNLWSEIIKKVSADGLDGLTDIERAELPESMDMSDKDYRERLRTVFKQHRNNANRNFDYFYQAQILWDETMAHSVDQFLRENPDSQMIVLAGNGHIQYHSGIPNRVHRLNGKDYATIIPGTDSTDEDIGDYLYLAEHLPSPAALKIGRAHV